MTSLTSRRWIVAIGVAAVVSAAAIVVVVSIQNQPTGKPIPGLNKPERLTLYSIDGTDDSGSRYEAAVANGAELFQKYVVLGKVKIDDLKERSRIVAALQQAAAYPDELPAKCFWPRHALVAIENDQQQEIVICFQCRQYTLDGKSFPVISRRPQKLLDDLLKRAGIPLVP
jgi:hypothetical protein